MPRSVYRLFFCTVLAMLAVTLAHGQTEALRTAYPPGSIDSVEKADQALLALEAARKKSDADFLAAEIACTHKILVNACLADVKTAHLSRNAEISSVEIEAKRVKRVAEGESSANDRKAKQDQRDANAQQDAAERAQNRTEYEGKQTDAAQKASDHASTAAQGPARAADYAAKLKEATEKEASDAATRRARDAQAPAARADQAQKEADAAERHDRLARKHIEKVQEREKKAAEQAQKNANLPPPPPPQVTVPGSPAVPGAGPTP